MDTKSENSNIKIPTEKTVEKSKSSKGKKGILLFLVIALLASIIIVNGSYYYFMKTSEIDIKTHFLQDNTINQELQRYTKNVNRFFVYFGGYEYENYSDEEKLKQTPITTEQIDLHKDEFLSELLSEEQAIEDEYRDKIRNSTSYSDTRNANNTSYTQNVESLAIISEKIYTEKSEKLDSLRKTYSEKVQNIEQEILNENVKNYLDIKSYLERQSSFAYYLYNNKTKELYTNIYKNSEEEKNTTLADYLGNRTFFYLDFEDDFFRGIDFSDSDLATEFSKKDFTGYIICPLSSGELIVKDADMIIIRQLDLNEYANSYYFARMNVSNSLRVAIVCSVLSVILLFLGRKSISSIFVDLKPLYKLYFKIPFIAKIIISFLSISYIYQLRYFFRNGFYYSRNGNFTNQTINVFIIIIFGILVLLHMILVIKNPKLIFDEPEIKAVKNFFKYINIINNSKCYFLIFTTYCMYVLLGLSFVLLIYMMQYNGSEILILYAICLVVWFFFYSLLINYIILSKRIEDIKNNTDVPTTIKKGIFSKPFYDLENIKDGISFSHTNMMKSERLKTELITNVSHDLKTPLTSIINYVELLKKEGLNSNRATEYLEVLDAKSQRLKYLIEDLFEASKLSSGTVELNLSKVNILDLLNQSMGELNEKIFKASIEFKINYSDKNIYLNVDGKKIWRVFENLINNIVNYSPTGGRAYIDIEDKNEYVTITFKNMSNYEMNADINELFERFKRGDSSRSTDGNGLGLAIAQNIVLLHGGDMKIIIDGDLFKVIVILKK